MENNTMTLFETIAHELSGKEFTKEDLQQIQERHEVARRRAVTPHLEASIKKIAYLIDKQTVLDTTKFTEEEITEAHVMKHARCTRAKGATLWRELYSNEEDCNKIMEKDIEKDKKYREGKIRHLRGLENELVNPHEYASRLKHNGEIFNYYGLNRSTSDDNSD